MLNIKVITILPEAYPGVLGMSLAGAALEKKLWNLEVINLRDFGYSKHKNVDDTSYGGGNGMVMRADVISDAIEFAKKSHPDSDIFYMSPRGRRLNQEIVKEIYQKKNIIILCGRFEGIDERIIDEYNVLEISLGDFILSGGEIASMALIDALLRLVPGVIANCDTLSEESFNKYEDFGTLLEYPQYTRPRIWKNREVPDILLSGNHQEIKKWRLEQSIEITKNRRPDLLEKK